MGKTLHLNLKNKWFDMILSGEKEEEYREISDYWKKRFCKMGFNNHPFCDLCSIDCHANGFRNEYSTITFSNGYAKNRRQFELELKRIKIDIGQTNWGAESDVHYFVLELGKMIILKNR